MPLWSTPSTFQVVSKLAFVHLCHAACLVTAIYMSFSEFFGFTPCCSAIMARACLPSEKNKPAWFYGISHQDDDAAKQNEKHARSLAWTTSTVDQSCQTWKAHSPTKFQPDSLIRWTFAIRFSANLRVLLVNYGEIKPFKPSDSVALWWYMKFDRQCFPKIGQVWFGNFLITQKMNKFQLWVSRSCSYWGSWGYSNSINWKYSMTITV